MNILCHNRVDMSSVRGAADAPFLRRVGDRFVELIASFLLVFRPDRAGCPLFLIPLFEQLQHFRVIESIPQTANGTQQQRVRPERFKRFVDFRYQFAVVSHEVILAEVLPRL
jgi:hypothetical protein